MWRLAVLVITASCGSSDPPTMMTIDAPKLPDAGCPMTACNPTAAASCSGTLACTWHIDDKLPEHGVIACVAPGAIPQGVGCTRDANGGDGCIGGTTCYQDKCRAICGLAGTGTACDAGLTCRATAYFIPCGATMPLAGLCLP